MNFNRTQFPPSGWIFFQSQTGWNNPMAMVSFDGSVTAIINHRNANPAITVRHKLATDRFSVGNELENYTRQRLGLPAMISPENPVPKSQAPSALASLSGRAQGAVADIKKLAAGAAVLFDWEQSGLPPVDGSLANTRAATCATCPKNQGGRTISEWFTEPIAEGIRQRLKRLHDMNLTTPSSDQLHLCVGCLCPLKLKVFVPIELAIKRLKPEQRSDLDPRCWILSEEKSLQNKPA